MTAQPPLAAVYGQACVAGATFGNPATVMALQGGSITSAIKEQESLLSLEQVLFYGIEQLRCQSALELLSPDIQRFQ